MRPSPDAPAELILQHLGAAAMLSWSHLPLGPGRRSWIKPTM